MQENSFPPGTEPPPRTRLPLGTESSARRTVKVAEQATVKVVDSAGSTGFVEEKDGSAPNSAEPDRSLWLLWSARVKGLFLLLEPLVSTKRLPAFLISLILHITLLLLLAVLTLGQRLSPNGGFDFLAVGTDLETSDVATSLLIEPGEDAAPPAPQIVEQSPPSPVESSDLSRELSELLRLDAQPTETGVSASISQLLSVPSVPRVSGFVATGVQGRDPGLRKQTALARGGTVQSEKAVEEALRWLAAHQLPNGGWSLVHSEGDCRGRCRNPGSPDRFDPAATGLSLLAFLGAGYTHKAGEYREVVRKGIYFLLQVMEETPQGGSFLFQSERGMYNHGIAAFAICEAYQMTGDKDLKKPAQQAIDFIVSAQNYQGGWGYLPKQPGDLTLSGWQLMALKSAHAAGLEMPDSTVFRVDPFLDTQQTPSTFFYGYSKPGKSPTCTSIGLVMRLFRGKPHTDPDILGGARFLADRSFAPGDAYYNYYATLFLFHVGEPYWKPWNERLREHLIASQEKVGHEAGSWYFEDPYGREGGRLYTTAMCAMTLEVYYRFAPLYQQVDLKFEL